MSASFGTSDASGANEFDSLGDMAWWPSCPEATTGRWSPARDGSPGQPLAAGPPAAAMAADGCAIAAEPVSGRNRTSTAASSAATMLTQNVDAIASANASWIA